jgi:hypothetical protein
MPHVFWFWPLLVYVSACVARTVHLCWLIEMSRSLLRGPTNLVVRVRGIFQMISSGEVDPNAWPWTALGN